MPTHSSMAQLPEKIRTAFERRLIDNGFVGYSQLAEWLQDQGYEISRSALGRHGLKIKRKLDGIRAATEAAKMIVAEAEDAKDDRSAAVMALLQTDLFNVITALKEAEDADPEERVKLLSQASRAVADLSRASISNKKHATSVREAEQVRVQKELSGMKKDPTLDAATLDYVTTALYGIG